MFKISNLKQNRDVIVIFDGMSACVDRITVLLHSSRDKVSDGKENASECWRIAEDDIKKTLISFRPGI
ncbi:hypothetical protein ACFQUX_13845 [Pantoea stewartii]